MNKIMRKWDSRIYPGSILIFLFLLFLVSMGPFQLSFKHSSFCTLSWAAEAPLANEDVIKLSKLGLGDEVVIGKINQAKEVAFKLDTDNLIKLKEAGISQAIIAAMLSRDKSDSRKSSSLSPEKKEKPLSGVLPSKSVGSSSEGTLKGEKFSRVDKFPQGQQTSLLIGGFMTGVKDVNVLEWIFNAPPLKVWEICKVVAERFDKIGKRPIVDINEKMGRIKNGQISQDSLTGMGLGAWMDEFLLEVTPVSENQSKVSVTRKVVELERKGKTTQRVWRTQWSNGNIESWLLTQIEDEIKKAGVEITSHSAIPVSATSIWPKGNWRGEVKQKGAPKYSVVIKLVEAPQTGKCGSINYPEIPCSGSLTYVSIEGEKIILTETIESGHQCKSGGLIHIKMVGDNKLQWEWLYPNGKKAAEAILNLE